MKQDIAEIAGKLTKAQRTFLMQEHWNFARGYKPGEKLVEMELFSRTRLRWSDSIKLTEKGAEVRAHLLAHSYTEKTA